MAKPRKVNSIDKHVAGKVRERRKQMGMSQGDLGNVLGYSFQQIQKYEACTNRISAGNLWKLGQALERNPAWFYEGMA